MRRDLLLAVLVFAAPLAALAQSSEDEAGDVSEVDKDRMGPLRERVRPVSGHVFLKNRRFEATPSVFISAKDAFYTKYILGGSLTYHLSETLAVSGRIGYSVPVVSGAAQICTTYGTNRRCTLPTMDELDRKKAPGKILLLGGGEAQWGPIYGKISLVAEQFVHFDLYGLAGGSAVQYLGPRGPAITVGGDIGLGMRFVFSRWIAARVELRELFYPEETSTNSALRNQMLVQFGLSMFFPTTFQEG